MYYHFGGGWVHFLNLSKSGIIAHFNAVISELDNLKNNNNTCYLKTDHLGSFVSSANVSIILIDNNFCISKSSKPANSWLKKHYAKFFKNQLLNNFESNNINVFDIFKENKIIINNFLKANLKGKIWKKQKLKWFLNSNKYRWLNVEIIPWLNNSGQVFKFLFIFEDITKEFEMEMSNKRLQQSNDLLESFNLVFSHDLMQPLRQIANFSDLLNIRYKDYKIKDPTMESSFSGMKKSIDHVKNLSEGISLYCKKGELTSFSENVNIKKLVVSILETSQQLLITRFKINIADNLCVFANPTAVSQLFQNLFANSVKYSPENTFITLSAVKCGGYAKFYLHNFGYCSYEIRKKNVFNAFESSKSDGSGLGLMICKKIITAYKGKIFLKSWRKKGTLVVFTLPLGE